jgi:hypothetical protein
VLEFLYIIVLQEPYRHRGGFTVGITDELSDEEQVIMIFLKRYFEQAGMPNAL